MAKVVKNLANTGDVAGHAGRRLVMAGQNRLDLMMLVGFKAPPIQIKRNALAPVHVEIHHIQIEAVAHINPEAGKLAKG